MWAKPIKYCDHRLVVLSVEHTLTSSRKNIEGSNYSYLFPYITLSNFYNARWNHPLTDHWLSYVNREWIERVLLSAGVAWRALTQVRGHAGSYVTQWQRCGKVMVGADHHYLTRLSTPLLNDEFQNTCGVVCWWLVVRIRYEKWVVWSSQVLNTLPMLKCWSQWNTS